MHFIVWNLAQVYYYHSNSKILMNQTILALMKLFLVNICIIHPLFIVYFNKFLKCINDITLLFLQMYDVKGDKSVTMDEVKM